MNDKVKGMLLILLTIGLAGIFVAFGAGKFIDPIKWTGKFINWGLPEWFVSVSGVLEVVGAIGLLIPILRAPAAIGLTLFMVGALTVHLIHNEVMMIFVAGTILGASGFVAWVRFPEARAFFQKTKGIPSNGK